MERQTRTKKYSDLRNQLENNNEIEGKTADLSTYENKLKSVEEALKVPTEEVQEEVPVSAAPEEIKEPETTIIEQVQTVEEMQENLNEDNNSSEDLLDLLDLVSEESTEGVSKAEESPAQETVVEEVQEETIPSVEEVEETVVSNPEVVEEVQETEVVSEEVVEPTVEEVVEETPQTETVVEEVSAQEVTEKTVEVQTSGDDYLEKTLEEVNQYNKAQGLLTADDVPERILGEVRGTAVEEVKEESEDLNNTVTLEIKKILASMEEEPQSEEVVEEVQEEPTQESTDTTNVDLEKLFATAGISKEAAELLKPYLKAEPIEESHEVVAQAIEVPEMSEEEKEIETAKIEEEIEKTKVDLLIADSDTTKDEKLLNDTIPFVIDTNEESKEEVVEEEEDSTPNKILNIILIVLIVVLLAVLGVIIYWILLAQGIL